MKRLLAELKEYKAPSIKAPLFMIGEVGLELSLPFLMAYIIDNGVTKGDMKTVVIMGLLMLAVAFLSLTCGALSAKYASFASAGFVKNLRRAMFENIQRFSFRNVDRYSTAGLVTRLMTDATNVQNAYMMILRMLVRAPMMLILAMVMTSLKIKVAEISCRAVPDGKAIASLTFTVHDVAELNNVTAKLRSVTGVENVRRGKS